MKNDALRLPERYVSVLLAQALLRKGYQVETDQRMLGGYQADLTAYKPPNRLRAVIEIKIIGTTSNFKSVIRTAKQQLAKSGVANDQCFVALGFRGSEAVFVDEGLLTLLSGAYDDLAIRPLTALGDASQENPSK